MGEALAEHLAQAWTVGDHGDPLPVGAREHFGAHQRVVTEQRHRVDLDPAVCIDELGNGLFKQRRRLSAIERQQVIDFG
ncbi:hypothetical protein D3C75_539140 [compost metagenome]